MTDQIQNMRAAEALECLRWGFDAMRSTPLTATHGARSVALSGDGVLTVTGTKTGEPLAVSVPGMVVAVTVSVVMAVVDGRAQSPSSVRPGWSAGRGPGAGPVRQ